MRTANILTVFVAFAAIPTMAAVAGGNSTQQSTPQGAATTVPLTAVEDTFAASGSTERNKPHGSDPRLWVGTFPPNGLHETELFVRFDLAQLPANAMIQSAKLHLYLKRATYINDADTIRVDVHRVTKSWSAKTLAWGNRPGHDNAKAATANVGVVTNMTVTWDLPLVDMKDWHSVPTRNFGYVLVTTPEGNHGQFVRNFLSSEGDKTDVGPGHQPPILEISYIVPPPTFTPSPTRTPTPPPDFDVAINAVGVRGALKPGTPVHPDQVIDFTVSSNHLRGANVPEYRLCADVPPETTLDSIVSKSPELTPITTPGSICTDGNYELQWNSKSLEVAKPLTVVYRVKVNPPTSTLSPPPTTSVPANTYTPSPTPTLMPTPGPIIDSGLLEPGSSVITATVGMPTDRIWGVALKGGLTNLPGPAPGLVAEAGYGPVGSDPSISGAAGWTFVPATWLEDNGYGFDRFAATFIVPAATAGQPFDMAYRFSLDSRVSWVYADTSSITTLYDRAYAGKLVVEPLPPLRFARLLPRVLPRRIVPSVHRTVLSEPMQTTQTAPTLTPIPMVISACAEGASSTLTPPPRHRSCILLGVPRRYFLPFVHTTR